MKIEELITYLPKPERLWQLLIDSRAWVSGPLCFDNGEGNTRYLQGMFIGLDFIIKKLLTEEEMSTQDIIDLHDMVIQCPDKRWRGMKEWIHYGCVYFPIQNPTALGIAQREKIVSTLNQQAKKNKVAFEDNKISRTCTTNLKDTKKDLVEVLSLHLAALNQLSHEVQTPKDKMMSILQSLLYMEFLHPFLDGNARTFLILLLNYFLIKNRIHPVQIYDTRLYERYSVEEIIDLMLSTQTKLKNPIPFYESQVYGHTDAIFFESEDKKPLEYLTQVYLQHYPLSPGTKKLTLGEMLSNQQEVIAVKETLLEPLPLSMGPFGNTSDLFWMISFNYLGFSEYLKSDLVKIKSLQSHQFITALCARRPDAAGVDSQQSALYVILINPGKNKLFFQFLNENPTFKACLFQHADFIDALLVTLPDTAGGYARTSALSALFSIGAGDKFFLQSLNEHTDFKNRLLSHPKFIEAFCATRPDTAGVSVKLSALYALLGTSESTNFFQFLRDHPDFKGQLLCHPNFTPALCAVRTSPGVDTGTSGLYWILRDEQERSELFQFLEDCPDFKRSIFELYKNNYHQFSVFLEVIDRAKILEQLPYEKEKLIALFFSSSGFQALNLVIKHYDALKARYSPEGIVTISTQENPSTAIIKSLHSSVRPGFFQPELTPTSGHAHKRKQEQEEDNLPSPKNQPVYSLHSSKHM